VQPTVGSPGHSGVTTGPMSPPAEGIPRPWRAPSGAVASGAAAIGEAPGASTLASSPRIPPSFDAPPVAPAAPLAPGDPPLDPLVADMTPVDPPAPRPPAAPCGSPLSTTAVHPRSPSTGNIAPARIEDFHI